MVYLRKTLKRDFYYGADAETIKRARELRNSMTASEKILWKTIRKHRFYGKIFRRQHPIYKFIVDFYCHEARLVIEVDGSIHNLTDQRERDLNRMAELERLGLKVIRFKNDEIRNNIESVLNVIKEVMNIS
jgi:very-short-patch-repair endonuclease